MAVRFARLFSSSTRTAVIASAVAAVAVLAMGQIPTWAQTTRSGCTYTAPGVKTCWENGVEKTYIEAPAGTARPPAPSYTPPSSDLDDALDVLDAGAAIFNLFGGNDDDGARERQRAADRARRERQDREAQQAAWRAEQAAAEAAAEAARLFAIQQADDQLRSSTPNPYASRSATQSNPAPSPYSMTPASPLCAANSRSAKLQALKTANQCLTNAQNIAGARLYLERLEKGEQIIASKECARPVNVKGQLDSFLECARVQICAAQTFSCVVSSVPWNLQDSDPACAATVKSCQVSHPVPR